MAKNRLAIAINGRQYTLVSDESVEYLNKLADNINEKVAFVRKHTDNNMGERPVIIAALNICDEYFKAEEGGRIIREQSERLNAKLLELAEENRHLHELFDNNEFELDIKTLQSDVERYQKIIEDQKDKIRHLENSIAALRMKNDKDMEVLKKRYEK